MKKDLVPNPPSHELAKTMVESVGKTQAFKATPHVRQGVANAISGDHYDEFKSHLCGGKLTGSAQADMYLLATKIAKWEADAGQTALDSALESGKIRLVDIVKRLAPELRKFGFDVRRGVCVGVTTQGAEQHK